MPQTCLDTADAIELAETLQLIARWLAADPERLAPHCSTSSATSLTARTPSAPTWAASPSSSAATTASSSSAKTPAYPEPRAKSPFGSPSPSDP
jgi:hypothetical protein